MHPDEESMIVVALTKKMEIIMSTQVVSFCRGTLITRKTVERKAFLANPKHKHRASQCGEHDCSASSKNRGDYYEYPSLSHFPDEL